MDDTTQSVKIPQASYVPQLQPKQSTAFQLMDANIQNRSLVTNVNTVLKPANMQFSGSMADVLKDIAHKHQKVKCFSHFVS